MHAVEQTLPEQILHPRAKQRLGRRRHEQHLAVAAMAGNDVGHVAGEQPVAIFLRIEQPETRTRQQLGTERQASGIERGGDDAERGKRRLLVRRLGVPAAANPTHP